MSSVYRQHLEAYLAKLDVSAERVIDVGGGSNPASGRVRSWKVRRCDILDNALEDPKAKVDFHHDMNLPLPAAMQVMTYDRIFCLELFDYIWHPVQACVNLRSFAHLGAKLTITFPFIYPNHNPAKYDMLRFTKFGAMRLLQHAGFAIDHVTARTIGDTELWRQFLDGEGYRYSGARTAETTDDSGYIIEAHAI